MEENKEKYEYRIKSPTNGYHSVPSEDPKVTGDSYKRAKKSMSPGEIVELQKRKIGPWEIIEKTENQNG